MSRTSERVGEHVRRMLFVAFAACTFWLVVENSILLVVGTHWWAEAHRARVELRHD